MKWISIVSAALLCLQAPTAARADDARADDGGGAGVARSRGHAGWLMSGASLGEGKSAFLGEAGWPGLQLSLTHGVTDAVDLGGYFGFDFGFYGITNIVGGAPGLRMGGIMRLAVIDGAKVNLGFRLSPGVGLYFIDPTALFAFIIPVDLLVGLPLTPQFSLHFGTTIPLAIFLGSEIDAIFRISFLAGAGLELKFDESLSLTLDSRFGPSIDLTQSSGSLQLRALLGVAYRF